MQFIDVLKTAFFDGTGARAYAEKQLVNYRTSNPSEFLKYAMAILIDENEEKYTRQAAGTLISESVSHLHA